MVDMPYFMTNEAWYYFDYAEKKYKINDNAPQKAKDSYKRFVKEVSQEIAFMKPNKNIISP